MIFFHEISRAKRYKISLTWRYQLGYLLRRVLIDWGYVLLVILMRAISSFRDILCYQGTIVQLITSYLEQHNFIPSPPRKIE